MSTRGAGAVALLLLAVGTLSMLWATRRSPAGGAGLEALRLGAPAGAVFEAVANDATRASDGWKGSGGVGSLADGWQGAGGVGRTGSADAGEAPQVWPRFDSFLPPFFAGIPSRDGNIDESALPASGFTLAQLKLCESALGGPEDPGGKLSCPADPSCVKCMSAETVAQVAPVTEAFHDASKRARRLELYERWFGPARGGARRPSAVNVVATDLNQLHVALNWACAAERQRAGVAKELLFVTGGSEDHDVLTQAGMRVMPLELMFDPAYAYPGKTQGFRWAMTLIIVLTADLVRNGYDVLMQDADVVWRADVVRLLETDVRLSMLDMAFQTDVRFDAQGPANTGVILVRSNRKTRLMMESMANSASMVYHIHDDQKLWNVFLRHYWFRQLHWECLTSKYVLLVSDDLVKVSSRIAMLQPSIVHRVSHQDGRALGKSKDLKALGLWHFNYSCPVVTPDAIPLRLRADIQVLWAS
jgi:hypothetical protein